MSKASELLEAKKPKEAIEAAKHIEDALMKLTDISGTESGSGGPIYKTMDLLRKALIQSDYIKD